MDSFFIKKNKKKNCVGMLNNKGKVLYSKNLRKTRVIVTDNLK
jgi:hypothetical protein